MALILARKIQLYLFLHKTVPQGQCERNEFSNLDRVIATGIPFPSVIIKPQPWPALLIIQAAVGIKEATSTS
jgi:hypothetical protein